MLKNQIRRNGPRLAELEIKNPAPTKKQLEDELITLLKQNIGNYTNDVWAYILSTPEGIDVARESILDTYISFQKAPKTNIWVAKTYTEEYDFCKMTWNKKEFEEFSLRYKNYYYHILNILKIANKKYETITYEELCNSNDKIKLISEKININKYIRKESTTIKL